ncbi:MAG: SirB2 family protein [Gammaproteobacteria bacterium]|nr:SirB2 family protein [Gammaproteobacteria bacterium]
MLAVVKQVHVIFALLSIAGFLLRGFWMMKNPLLLHLKLVKVLPHVVDTVLLLSAISLLVMYGWNPLDQSWIMAKIVALLLYIYLGTVALKRGKSKSVRNMAFVAAVVTFVYIYATAISHNPMPF